MRVKIVSEEEKEEESKTENPTEPDADTTQELTAAIIAQLNEESYSSEEESMEGRILPIEIEYASGTDKLFICMAGLTSRRKKPCQSQQKT